MDQIDPKSIVVGERQRQDYGDLTSLKASIQRHGIIQPIIVTQMVTDLIDEFNGADVKAMLVAGGRRLKAAIELALPVVPIRWYSELSHLECKEIELEENVKRKDLSWQEECAAVLAYHEVRLAQDPDWTIEKTGDALCMDTASVWQRIQVQREIIQNPAAIDASSMKAVFNQTRRKVHRQLDTEMAKFLETEHDPDVTVVVSGPGGIVGVSPSAGPIPRVNVCVGDFLELAPAWQGPKFNFLHCDFPYGIQMDTSALQGTRSDFARYADSEDLYWSLCKALCSNLDRILHPSAHVMFWFSMNYYIPTVELFTSAGFVVNPFPLIWHKADGKGILPDPSRGGRRTYETALLLSRGDRRIVNPVALSIAAPTSKNEALHLSEKPMEVLEHFFKMFVDETTEMLDPTCGSGTALAVAERYGAASIVGMDVEKDFVEISRERVNRERMLRGLVG